MLNFGLGSLRRLEILDDPPLAPDPRLGLVAARPPHIIMTRRPIIQ